MQRPSRENIERQIRATLMLYGYPVDRFEAGMPRFDDAHEKLIVDHANELDRLWSDLERCERQIIAAGDPAEPKLMRRWYNHADAIASDICSRRYGVTLDEDAIASLDARYADKAPPHNPSDPYECIGGEA